MKKVAKILFAFSLLFTMLLIVFIFQQKDTDKRSPETSRLVTQIMETNTDQQGPQIVAHEIYENEIISNTSFGDIDKEQADEIPLKEDVFFLDLSFFQLWESGDYSTVDGTPCESRRRLRYNDTIEALFTEYIIEVSDDYNLLIYEYDDQMKYLTFSCLSNGATFIPSPETAYFKITLFRTYSEKSLSLGQWAKLFPDVTITLSHGDMDKYNDSHKGSLISTTKKFTDGNELLYEMVNNQGDELADKLWQNQILCGVYNITGEELNNDNLTLYFSSSIGNDSNSGLSPEFPKRSIEPYSGVSNINILLKCSDEFRLSSSFIVGNNSLYAAYGEGNRPILNFYQSREMIFEKVDGCENVWSADISMLDICNHIQSKSNCNIGQLVINGEVNWKRKVGSSDDIFDPSSLSVIADGSWAADWNTSKLYLYSINDPNNCKITYAPPLHGVSMNNVENVVFKGIEITGAGFHGISMKNVKNILITNCYLHHIGGSILVSAGARYGNAIQLWNSGENVQVAYNYADWIFDTCYTNQGNDKSAYENNVVFNNNIGSHSFWGVETWGDGYSDNAFGNVEYHDNLIFSVMDITNPEMPMFSNKNGKLIFLNSSTKKEDYVSYRNGYTYHQMSSVNVSNSGTGLTAQVYDNIFLNTNRFLAYISNPRGETIQSCLHNNLFFCETGVSSPALFRYTTQDDTRLYLESLEGYIDTSNKVKIVSGFDVKDKTKEQKRLVKLINSISGRD